MLYVLKQTLLRSGNLLHKPLNIHINPRLWAAALIVIAQLAILFVGMNTLHEQNLPAPTDFRINPNGSASVSGLVLVSSNGCSRDTNCRFDLRIENGQTLHVVYYPGEGDTPCSERLRSAGHLADIRPGTEITAYGLYEMYQGQRYLNVCALPDAYLKITAQP